MKPLTDSFQFKNVIKEHAVQITIDADFFDRCFANVFVEIFEKAKQAQCLLKRIDLDLSHAILSEVQRIGKKNKADFLLLFEDYQKMSAELDEIIFRIKKDCSVSKTCEKSDNCILNLAHFPLLCERTNNIDLKTFKPDHTLNPDFLKFVEKFFGKSGLYFLYSSDEELMYIGKGANVGGNMLETIWLKNIEGYACVATTENLSDSYLYEPYYILLEKPLLNSYQHVSDELSLELPLIEKTELVKIFNR